MDWLDRQSFLGDDSNELLAALTIGIVGLGGGGSHVGMQCAHVGVGGFVLVDDDHIDESNLNRLVGGTLADVKSEELKVNIAARTILAVNPSARILPVVDKWQNAVDALRHCDVIFGCIDNIRGKDELEDFCRRLLIPYIDQGMDVHVIDGGFLIAGQVALSMPGGPCLRCLGIVTDDALDEEARNYGAAGGKPQVIWPNGVLASTAVGLFMQTVAPWRTSRDIGACLEYDGNTHVIRPSDRFLRLRARTCPHRSTTDLGDPTFDVRTAREPISERKTEPTLLAPAVPWWSRGLRWVATFIRG